ncbi:hypothetical protein [Sphingomonas montana]|uniref:hypothetical protein n=1 Tax=Sphingomonas montana TaxID=1843236 RepID=UPI00096F3BD2|nr:hypothetical protein [Sphingomonas montana]
METRYTRRADDLGWLSVRLTKGGGRAALCEYTEVAIVREAAGRTYFTIRDGYIAVGQEASLSTANAASYLSKVGPGAAAKLVVTYTGVPVEENSAFKGKLTQQWARLAFNGQTATVTLNSVWDQAFTPIPPGTHAILTPDYSHAKTSTAGYAQATPGMVGNDVWFPIGLNASGVNSTRYVHVGHLSDGCVTVHELGRWTALYTYLISHRVAGTSGKRIGSLVVHK